MSIRVLSPGWLTSVQDSGRSGHAAIGVGRAGAMDDVALRLANALVGNAENAAALEITLRGPRLRFDSDALIALTGAVIDARCATQEIPPWRPVWIPAGSELELGGMRAVPAPISPLPAASTSRQRSAAAARTSMRHSVLSADAVLLPATTCRLATERLSPSWSALGAGHPATAPDTTALPRRTGRSIRNRGSTRAAIARCACARQPFRKSRRVVAARAVCTANSASATNPTASAIASKEPNCGCDDAAGIGLRRRRAGHDAVAAERQSDRADGRSADDRRLSAHRHGRDASTCRAWRSAGPATTCASSRPRSPRRKRAIFSANARWPR